MIVKKKTLTVFSNVTTEKFMHRVQKVDVYSELGNKDLGGLLYGNDQSRYNDYAKCSVDSFKKWHPDIETIYIDDDNLEEYLQLFGDIKLSNCAVVQKLIIALYAAKHFKAEKLIILDIDTITTARLTEMLEDDETDMLLSLNYNRYETTKYWTPPSYVLSYEDGTEIKEVININTGVMCFNNLLALEKAVELCFTHPTDFGEQGAINQLFTTDKTFTSKVLDGPYILSDVVYNVKAKGVDESGLIFRIAMEQPQNSYIKNWYVKEDKLFTPDHKHIKVWHIAEGLHGRPKGDFDRITEMYKTKLFNRDTINFFENNCDCKKFFN